MHTEAEAATGGSKLCDEKAKDFTFTQRSPEVANATGD